MKTDKKSVKDLFFQAQHACENAYAPYSKLHVGAILLTENGNVFTGCNVENASYGLTVCAERNAIAAAVNAEGKKMKIKFIAVAEKNKLPISPCGACRQVIAEFSTAETEIIFNAKGKGIVSKKINELLPFGFKLKSA